MSTNMNVEEEISTTAEKTVTSARVSVETADVEQDQVSGTTSNWA